MANLLELFDDFAKPVYVKYTLGLGHEGKNIILVIDDTSKKAVLQYNLFDINGNLFEVLSQNENQLYSSIHDFLKAFRSSNFSYDAEEFFTGQNQYLDIYLNDHIGDAYYIPNMVLYSVYNEIE